MWCGASASHSPRPRPAIRTGWTTFHSGASTTATRRKTGTRVYFREHAIFVAERPLGGTAWTPRLRIDVPKSTELLALNPGWH